MTPEQQLAALKQALDDLILEYNMERSSFAKRVDEIFEQGLAAQHEPGPACWQGEDGCPNRQACCDAQHCLYTTPPAAQQEPVKLRRGAILRCIETEELCTVWATSTSGKAMVKWSANNFGNYTAEQIGELFWIEPEPAAQPAPAVTDLAAAIEYADARWSGVDVPIEWARHFANAICTPPAAQPAPAIEGVKPMQMLDALVQKYSDQLYDGKGAKPANEFELDVAAIRLTLAAQPAQQLTDEKGRPLKFWGGKAVQEPVGEVGTMPGTAGFTMACFKAEVVPVGTKLYTAAQPAPVSGYIKKIEDLIQERDKWKAAATQKGGEA